MTNEEFIKVLKKNHYSYEIEGDKIIVTSGDMGHVWLDDLTSLPPGVKFINKGRVRLDSLTSLPPDVVFKNGGNVNLDALTSIPPGVEFKNGGSVDLSSSKTISPGVEFKNGGVVYLKSLIGGRFNHWNGNIEGIDSKRLLNFMISKEMFI